MPAETYLAVDTETTGLSPYHGHKVDSVGICDQTLRTAWRKWSPETRELLQKKINEADVVIMHNAKFDMKMLQFAGIKFPRLPHDTMGMARLLQENFSSIGLKPLAREVLGEDTSDEKELKDWLRKEKAKATRQGTEPPLMCNAPNVKAYCMKDCELTMKLFWRFKKTIKEDLRDIYRLERELTPVVIDMENTGIRVDLKYVRDWMSTCQGIMDRMETELHNIAGEKFNLNSHQQIQRIMHQKLKLPVIAYKISYASDTSMDVLEKYGHEFPKKLLAYRQNRKLLNTYFKRIMDNQVDGILHGEFLQYGTRTGRFSGNMQQYPRGGKVRNAFIPRKGHVFLFFDYSQIEMRIFAHHSQDKNMLKIIEKGGDLHARTAEMVFGKVTEESRQIAKNINFGIIYGMGSDKFAAQLGMSEEEAAGYLDTYHKTFPRIRRYMAEVSHSLEAHGYLADPFGRRFRLPKRHYYKGINSLVQGGAASLLKTSMLRIWNVLKGTDCRMLLTIHDELCIEAPNDGEIMGRTCGLVKRLMTDYDKFGPQPIEVDVKMYSCKWGSKEDAEAVEYADYVKDFKI